jgi:phage-related protein
MWGATSCACATAQHSWRVVYRLDPDAIVLVAVFAKRTQATTKEHIQTCRDRLRHYDEV